MRYALLIYTNETEEAQMAPEDHKAMMGGYYAFTEEVKAAGKYVTGAPLQPTSTATSVRVKDGAILPTDGPFAETREQLGGFYLLDCSDLDDAIAQAAKIPGALHGTIEIRPVMVYG